MDGQPYRPSSPWWGVRWLGGAPQPSAHPVDPLVFDHAPSTDCVHQVHTMLMPMPQTPPLRCGPVSQTPTDDQLGDQRYGPVGAEGDLAANQHSCGCACPADQSASDLPRAAACGPSVGHSAVDQWQAPMYAASSLSGSLAVGHSRAVPNSAVCRDAQSDEERRLTERYRTEPLPASTLDVTVPATTQNATALRRTFRR